MKIELTERELTSLIKKKIVEIENNYTTIYKHILTDKNTGKKYVVNTGDIWTKKTRNNETYYQHKNGLYFTCSGKNITSFEEEDMYTESNIKNLQNSDKLYYTMKSKLC